MTEQAINQVELGEEWDAVKNSSTIPVDPSGEKKKTGFNPLHFSSDIVKHVSYEYVVMMVLNQVGITQTSNEMKKIADLQKIEDTIHSVVDNIGQLIQKLSGYAGKDDKIDPSFFNDPKVKALLGQAAQEWTDLFKKGGYMDKWKDLLSKDGDDATSNPAYNMVNDLKKNLDNGWDKSNGKSFTDILNAGTAIDKDGNFNSDLMKIFEAAYHTSHAHNDPNAKTRPTKDPLSDTTGTITNTASTVGGLTNSNSTELTQESQQLTSYVQIGQKILSTTDQMKSTMTRNQKY